MPSVGLLTVNGEHINDRNLVEIAEDARTYFPKKTWDEILYLGRLRLDHDIKVVASGECRGAFLFRNLTKRIDGLRRSYQLIDVLLAVTSDPIVSMHYFIDRMNMKRMLYLIHDYVDRTVGVISFFRVKEKSSSKVVAHGLGHSRGLRHHLKPIDLMSSELLKADTLQVEGFCEACLRRLAGDHENG